MVQQLKNRTKFIHVFTIMTFINTAPHLRRTFILTCSKPLDLCLIQVCKKTEPSAWTYCTPSITSVSNLSLFMAHSNIQGRQ